MTDMSVLIYGVSGSGKSTLAVELAKHLYKDEQLRTVVFLADEGSRMPYEMLGELGVVRVVEPHGNPWVWVHRAFRGERWDGKGWVDVKEEGEAAKLPIGLIVHDGLTAYAEMLMQEMARMSAEGINIGGEGLATLGKDREKDGGNVLKSWTLKVGEGKDQVKVGGNSQAHYGIAQVQVREGLLAGRPKVTHLYTATLRRGNEEGRAAPVVGPQIVGGALTGALPRWLDYTFMVDVEGSEHVLYLMPHQDQGMGKTIALANPRLPREGERVKVPQMIKPASLVKALAMLEERREAAREDVMKELGL